MRKIMLAGLAIFGLAAVLAAAAPVDDTGTKVKPDVAPAAAAKTNNLNPSKSNASRHRANPASEIPIEGVEVSLRKWPGKAVLVSMTTSADGAFDFGVQEEGSYSLMVNPPPDQVADSAAQIAADTPADKTVIAPMPPLRRVKVVFEGVEDGPITAHLRFSTKEIQTKLQQDKPGSLGISLPLETNGNSAIKGVVTEDVAH